MAPPRSTTRSRHAPEYQVWRGHLVSTIRLTRHYPLGTSLTGMHAVLATVIAIRERERTGKGTRVRVALADVALSVLSSLGFVDQETTAVEPRNRDGNYLYGAFGRDFLLADRVRVMVVAITAKQWRGLVEALGIGEDVARIEAQTGLDLRREGDRFRVRRDIASLIETWCATRSIGEVSEVFDRHEVTWSRYESATAFADSYTIEGPGKAIVADLGEGSERYRSFDTALRFSDVPPRLLRGAPRLGQHTEEVLAGILGLGSAEIGRLVSSRVVQIGT